MSAFDKFEKNLMGWLNENGINDVMSIKFGMEYQYEIDTHTIVIGTSNDWENDELFNVYLRDHGCVCAGIPGDIMSFLHEVGHNQTIHEMMNNDDKFIERCNECKQFWYNNAHTEREGILGYWSSPDEAAANQWEVQFINNHQGAVVDLYDIWEKFIEDFANDILCAIG